MSSGDHAPGTADKKIVRLKNNKNLTLGFKLAPQLISFLGWIEMLDADSDPRVNESEADSFGSEILILKFKNA